MHRVALLSSRWNILTVVVEERWCIQVYKHRSSSIDQLEFRSHPASVAVFLSGHEPDLLLALYMDLEVLFGRLLFHLLLICYPFSFADFAVADSLCCYCGHGCHAVVVIVLSQLLSLWLSCYYWCGSCFGLFVIVVLVCVVLIVVVAAVLLFIANEVIPLCKIVADRVALWTVSVFGPPLCIESIFTCPVIHISHNHIDSYITV